MVSGVGGEERWLTHLIRLHKHILATLVDGHEAPPVMTKRIQTILQSIALLLVFHGDDLIMDGATLDRLRV